MNLDDLATIALDAPVRERLDALEHDPNLQHTAARWMAHEAVYPGMGATSMLNLDRDRETLAQLTVARDEFREKLPADHHARLYMEWLVDELTHAIRIAPQLVRTYTT